jgi:hypothetical protein
MGKPGGKPESRRKLKRNIFWMNFRMITTDFLFFGREVLF